MNAPAPDVVLLASDLPTKGDRVARALDDRCACALTTGRGPSINPKVWPCEDSVAALALPGGRYLLAVADAHWGGSTSVAVCRGLRAAWDAEGLEAVDPAGLRRVLERLDAELEAAREVGDGDASETTALVVHVEPPEGDQPGRLTWFNAGDSLLCVIRRGEVTRINTLGPLFIGRMRLASLPPNLPADIFEGTSAPLEPDSIVLLATDGLEPEASALSPRDLWRELGRRPESTLLERVEKIASLAEDPARGAGRDNLGLVVLDLR